MFILCHGIYNMHFYLSFHDCELKKKNHLAILEYVGEINLWQSWNSCNGLKVANYNKTMVFALGMGDYMRIIQSRLLVEND